MKAACIILTILISVAVMAVCVMVKFATDITVDEKKRELQPQAAENQVAKSIAVIARTDNNSVPVAERFPYVAAIASNTSNSWSFACFASVILGEWVVTAAHCRKQGATHRVLLLYDFTQNVSRTFPVLYWRIHEKFSSNSTVPMYDIAVAKFDMGGTPPITKPSTFDDRVVADCEACIWKTVSTMDRKIFLINDFDKFHVKIAPPARCYESYGVQVESSMICVDLSAYDDCFVHEFGPIYSKDRLVGVLAATARNCEVKFALFTNVSHYAPWITKLTHTPAH